MSLYDDIVKVYPELTIDDFDPMNGKIHLHNAADGKGDYIAKWQYNKPIPEEFKLGK